MVGNDFQTMKHIEPRVLRVPAESAGREPVDETGRWVDGVARTEVDVPRRHQRRRGGWAAGFILLLLMDLQARGDPQTVQVTDHLAARGEMGYEIQSADCLIRWTVTRAGINAGVAQQRSNCRLPVRDQVSLQSQVLARMVAEEPALRTLFWGRLGTWPEWSARLVEAATRSPVWNGRSGRPNSGRTMSEFLLALMADRNGVMFEELGQVLGELNLHMKISGVEKVSVAALGTLPAWKARLVPPGNAASLLVPHDCLLWFTVEKAGK